MLSYNVFPVLMEETPKEGGLSARERNIVNGKARLVISGTKTKGNIFIWFECLSLIGLRTEGVF